MTQRSSYPRSNSILQSALVAGFLALSIGVASAAEKSAPKDGEMAKGGYCTNILDAVSEARAAFRLKKLKEVEAKLEDRITMLEEKSREVREWLEKRQKFVEMAQGQLVAIYKQMRPDAAALQISALDEMTAAAILLKLKPRTASAILNEMDPKLAARLASFVSYAAKTKAKKEKS